MTEPVETSAATLWVDENILHIRSKGVVSTRDTVVETFEAVGTLTKGSPLPALCDVRMWASGDSESWLGFISAAPSSFTAVAVLVDPDRPPEMAGYPDAIDRLLMPFRMFTDEAEALAFLMPDRSS